MAFLDSIIRWLSNGLTTYPRFFIPIFTYVLFSLLAWFIRKDSSILTKDIPKTGSELCKIACGILLGSIVIGFDSPPLKNSLLAQSGSANVTVVILFGSYIVFFLGSYWLYTLIEGKRIYKDLSVIKWCFVFILSQFIGWIPFVMTISALIERK